MFIDLIIVKNKNVQISQIYTLIRLEALYFQMRQNFLA